MTRPAALAFCVVAAAAWLGELLFLVANARAFGSLPHALGWMSGFLTDWTGVLLALVATALAVEWRHLASPWWAGLTTVSGVLVGLMFGLLGGWARLSLGSLLGVSSVLAHVVAPWAMLLAWIFAMGHGALRWRDAAKFMLFPAAYLFQMFARGALGGGCPYPEVDVNRVGLGPALAFAGAVTLLFLVLGLLLVVADHLFARARGR